MHEPHSFLCTSEQKKQNTDQNQLFRVKEMSCGGFTVPPGYRFHPTDERLLSDLEEKNQCQDSEITTIIPEIDVCKHEPRELPELAFTRAQNLGRKFFSFFFFWFAWAESWDSQGKWYFFTPREYKYPNSRRSNRTTGEGFWKITGKDRDIKAPGSKVVIGRKRTLTFYKRGVPKSQKTGWVIHEYYLIEAHSDPPKQIGDFVVCCLKYKSDNYDHDEDAPFCNRDSGNCIMASNVANRAEENLASNKQVNVVPIPNGSDDEAKTGGGRITEAEEHLAFKQLGDALQIPIGNPHEFQGFHQLHQSHTTNVHNDECHKRKYPFEDNDSSLPKKNNISTNDDDELVTNTTCNSDTQAADVIPGGISQPGTNLGSDFDSYPKQAQDDFVNCRLKNKSDSACVSNWENQAADEMNQEVHKNDESLFHQPQPLDDCCSSALRLPASLVLEAVRQANGTNDDCNKLQSPFGDSCHLDRNEVSTCDRDETMDDVLSLLRDPPEQNLNSLFGPHQPQDYCTPILQLPIYTKLGNVPDANLYYSECNNWQSAFKKKNSTDEVDIPVRHNMSNSENEATDYRILEVHHPQTKENLESVVLFQPQDSTLQSMMYTVHGDALHNIECNELQPSFGDDDVSFTKLLNTIIVEQDHYSSDQEAQTPSIDSNLPKSSGRVDHGDSGVSSNDTNTEVAHGCVQYSSALPIGNTL